MAIHLREWYGLEELPYVAGIVRYGIRRVAPRNTGWIARAGVQRGRFGRDHQHSSRGDVVYMRPGEHSLLFYNNDTEYIVFDKMQSFASAKATTRTRTRSSYLGNSYMDTKNENTVNQPDMLYGSYMESYVAERSTETDVIPVTMHPLVFTYLVRYEFSHGWNTCRWHAEP